MLSDLRETILMKRFAGIFITLALTVVALTNTDRPAYEASALADEAAVAKDMAAAARQFLQHTPEAQHPVLVFPFDSEERANWNFVPMPGKRKGLSVKEMSADQRQALHTLLQSILSGKGYLKATYVQQLEEILADIEENPVYRDPELYYLTLFGAPSEEAPWGWRFEGHHLSLNFSSVENKLAVLPAFMGANPAEVRTGQFSGLRVLHEETDVARALMHAFSSAQRERALIDASAPRDIITGNDREAVLERFEGLPYAEMTQQQQRLLQSLIDVYASNLEPDIASVQRERIEASGYNALYFAWAGSLEENEPHYYRVHGPTLLIEYDNTQNNANHIHAAWRDLTNDFGRDLLRQHYDASEPGHGH